MTDQKAPTPSVGRIVHYFPGVNDPAACANGLAGSDPVAAVIVRVWSDSTLNLRLLLDCVSTGDGTPIKTSVQRRDLLPEATGSPVPAGHGQIVFESLSFQDG